MPWSSARLPFALYHIHSISKRLVLASEYTKNPTPSLHCFLWLVQSEPLAYSQVAFRLLSTTAALALLPVFNRTATDLYILQLFCSEQSSPSKRPQMTTFWGNATALGALCSISEWLPWCSSNLRPLPGMLLPHESTWLILRLLQIFHI